MRGVVKRRAHLGTLGTLGTLGALGAPWAPVDYGWLKFPLIVRAVMRPTVALK